MEVLAVAAAAAGFFYLVTFRDGTFLYLFHKATTGPYLDEGARVAAGEVPYRDFVARASPGILYLDGALVRLFGQSLTAMAAAGIFMGCALAAALHALAAAIVRGPWRFAPAAVFVLIVYPPADLGGHKWPALLMAVLAARALAAQSAGAASALAAGLACGVAAVFSPVLGLAAGAGLALHLALERPPRWHPGALAAGALFAAGLPALLLAERAGAAPVLRGWWAAGFTELRTFDPLGRWRPLDCAYLIVALAGVAAGVRALRVTAGDEDGGAAERLAARAGLVVLAASTAGHVEPYALAAYGTLLSVAAAAAASRTPRRAGMRRARQGAAAVLAFCALYSAGALVAWRQWRQPVVRQTFRAGTAWLGAPSQELAWLESHARPSDRTFVFPAGGASYFLTWTRNATSFPYMIEGVATEGEQRRALAEIDAARPAFGIWMGRQRFEPPPGRPRLDVLQEGVFRRYAVERTLPDGTMLLRLRAAPEGLLN